MNHSKFQVLSKWTHSKDFVLDPPGLDDQRQFIITFHPLYDFLSLNKVKVIKFQVFSIGPTHGSKLWSGFSASNGLLAMAKLLASSACSITFLKRRNISQSNTFF